MDCPRGHGALLEQQRHGVAARTCAVCAGEWLTADELEQLEASAVSEPDVLRGMVEYQPRDSDLTCPVCAVRLHAFDYRGNPLELDVCPAGHGYWLDGGEDARVQELIRQRARDLHRASRAEASFGAFVDGLRRQLGGGGHHPR